jgi:hypothetical protein
MQACNYFEGKTRLCKAGILRLHVVINFFVACGAVSRQLQSMRQARQQATIKVMVIKSDRLCLVGDE